LLQNTRSKKTCLMFTTYVGHALIVVMRKNTRDIEEIHEHLVVRGFMRGYTCWTEHDEYKEVVLEDTDVGGDDDVDQMNHCWTEQNMS
jgi:hypothetical protein